MVMTKPSSAPTHLADMGQTEAEEVTQAIKDNFDSLGAMLAQARDRKAYKALGYRSFETYCQTEFGKSISSAYQLIEDAKVISQLEERISQNYGEEVTLKLPSSHLQTLKEIANIDDKLKAIEYAQQLAKVENRKPTKRDLEIAVFKVSGKRSEDFKKAIKGLGLVKGTPVEVLSPIKKDRGVITRIDKSGKIYVELYYYSAKAMPFNPEELRILSDKERPANPLEGSIASKGDRVLIYAMGLEGQGGTIYTWKEGKEALVMVDGQNSPVSIAYAEMELIKKPEKKNASWDSELVWESGKNTYYYFPQENKISSNLWPTGLTLEPYTHSGTPLEFIQNWENRFSHRVLEALATPARTKTLVLAQAIELPETQAKEFADDLIASLHQLFWDEIPGSPSALMEENQRLREQLAEAEAAIQAIVNAAKISSPGDTAAHSDFLLENDSHISSPGDTAAHSDFLLENDSHISSPGDTAAHSDFLLENDSIVSAKRERVRVILEQEKQNLSKTNNEKKRAKIKNNIRYAEEQLEGLDKFKQFKVGDTLIKTRFPDRKGILKKIEITPTGMPLAWVEWPHEYQNEPSTPEQHPLGVLTNLSIQNEEHK